MFLIRSAGQWPAHQTEIHFHPSTPAHRDAAQAVLQPLPRNVNKSWLNRKLAFRSASGRFTTLATPATRSMLSSAQQSAAFLSPE